MSEQALAAAEAAMHAAVSAVAPARQNVAQLVGEREAAGQPLPTARHNKSACSVLLPPADARQLVGMLCPAFDALLALQPATAGPLADMPFVGPNMQHWGDPDPTWQPALLQPLTESQMLNPAGLHFALRLAPGGSAFMTAVATELSGAVAAQFEGAQPQAAAGQAPGGLDGGLRGFFWAALQLVRREVELGLMAKTASKAPVLQVVRHSVYGVAQVACMLVSIHNLLLQHAA